MPRIVETVVYELPELSESARERARAWYRDTCLDHEWYDAVFEDFQTVCGLLGVTLRTRTVRLTGGGTREVPKIFFTGFWSQGDGASYEASYSYVPRAARCIRTHAPKDEDLHAIADALQDTQKRNIFQLAADIRQSGRYCHEYTTSIEVERDSPTGQTMTDGAEDTVAEAMRNLARWLFRHLQSEYDYLTSDDAVDEAIAANGFSFTETGVRFG